jgi:DNA primase
VNEDFRAALVELKDRLPIEEVVRSYVPTLKRQGALWVACCPFHEEKTPSFKVDPRRGTWHCYGACAAGGDQISFVERIARVEFLEAVEILASRAGVSMPDRRSREALRQREENQPLYDVLERAQRFFARQLGTPDGARALEYLRGRGLADATLSDFGVGWAPAGGADGLAAAAQRQGCERRTLVAAGLARESERGGLSDFFFGRVIFPVRDLKGRCVGFGARRVDDAQGGPKYVNTPETVLFHKGRLIYGLDRALEVVRKSGHILLVEGYTDVMAAHQAGFGNVVAVLGTATTEDHAALVRRSGARRVSLVFDGDEAGRRATQRALAGLLALDVSIDVVRLPGGQDPCDLVVSPGGAESFRGELERARGWFESELEFLGALEQRERLRAVDVLLELCSAIPRPLEREARLEQLARALDVPAESVRLQYESLPQRRRETLRKRAEEGVAPAQQAEAPETGAPAPGERRAWRDLVGAVLLEPQLAAEAAAWRGAVPDQALARVLEAALAVDARLAGAERLSAVLAELGEHPARHQVVPLLEDAAAADAPREAFAFAARTLIEARLAARARAQLADLEDDDPERERAGLTELFATLRDLKAGRVGDQTTRRDAAARVN